MFNSFMRPSLKTFKVAHYSAFPDGQDKCLNFQVSRHSERIGSGVVKMMSRNNSASEIFVATLDGRVRLFDVRLGKVVADCSGHTASILDFAQSR